MVRIEQPDDKFVQDCRLRWERLQGLIVLTPPIFKRRMGITPRGDKDAYTDKQKRKAEDIEEGYEKRGVAGRRSRASRLGDR